MSAEQRSLKCELNVAVLKKYLVTEISNTRMIFMYQAENYRRALLWVVGYSLIFALLGSSMVVVRCFILT